MELLVSPKSQIHDHTEHFEADCTPGYLLKENKDYGSELALGSSLTLVGAATSRCIKTNWKAPVPLGLFATGSLASWYFLKKYKELNYGV